ncbi:hypothetical protein HYT32_00525 [Candidatus Roizmanbacteria bacterium]|nr:hypothetical protein [Candidatus Roizmanbacteria bacterium]
MSRFERRMGQYDVFIQGANQRTLKRIEETRRRAGGDINKKAYKAEQKRRREELKYAQERIEFQLERALGKIFSGDATSEEAEYYFKHEPRLGKRIDKQVTIIDIPSTNGKI